MSLPAKLTQTRLNFMFVLATVLPLVTTVAWAGGMKEINRPKAADATQMIALEGGRLIDGHGGPPIENSVLVISGTQITQVGTRGDVVIPKGAVRVDCRGLSILPGLIDSHFHSKNDTRIPVAYELMRGITSFRDPGHPFKFYREVLASDAPMPRVFLCGGHLDADPIVWPGQAVEIQDAEHARRTVRDHVSKGASAIKVYFRLPLPHIQAACESASEQGVLVTAHLELVDADAAIGVGVRGIEHVSSFGTALAASNDAEQFRSLVQASSDARKMERHRLWAKINVDSSPRVQPLLDLIVRHKVFVSPTLAIFERRESKAGTSEAEVVGFANMLEFVKRCHEAGAKVVVGSHTSAPFAARGRAYQRELELFVEAGMTPLQAITAGTLHNAQFLGIEDRLGTIEVGKTADLVLVKGDPSQQIAAMERVHRVMLNGNWVVPQP